ncbi:MAG: hypothetical protein K8T90_14850 [Planctomycetes bacterium]|nr:hypothetical protein [Planctomycetota bacterium]
MRGVLVRAVTAIVLVSLGLAIGLPTPPSEAIAGELPADPEAALRSARVAVVPRLVEFAAWCNAKGLPRSRDRALEAALRFDADNAAARRALRYTRSKSGTWERAKAPPSANEPDPATVPEFAKRRDDATADLRTLAQTIAEARVAAPSVAAPSGPGLAPAPTSPAVSPALHEMAVDDLVALMPDDERVRALSRETLAPGGWRLDETLRARVRRSEIAAMVASSRAELAPQTHAIEDAATAVWGVKWVAGVQGSKTRVFGAPRTAEAADACAACDVATAIHQAVLGVVPLEVKGLTVFLFASGADAWAAMDRDPRFSAADRQAARGLGGWWVSDKPHALTWVENGPARIDAALRQTVGLRLRWQSGVDTRRGWAWEGFGLYFSEAVLASHLTVFAGESSYGPGRVVVPGLADRLRADTSDWLAEGRALESGDAWPDFRVMLGRPVESMSPEEVLQGYLLARYLVEGRPEVVPATIAALGKAAGPDAWCASALACTVDGLERRLRRWTRESAAK